MSLRAGSLTLGTVESYILKEELNSQMATSRKDFLCRSIVHLGGMSLSANLFPKSAISQTRSIKLPIL